MKKHLLFLLMAVAALPGIARQDKKPNVLELKTSITDKAIVYP